MKVVILCGGRGERLREETEFRPKPMINIGGRPILWHIMKTYSMYGYNDFVLALGYKGDMIRRYFIEYMWMNNPITVDMRNGNSIDIDFCEKENWKVTLVDTGENSLKGSRLKQLEPYIDGNTFMATYGDGLSDVDINRLVSYHMSHGKIATVTGVNLVSKFGRIKISENDVESFIEKPIDDDYSNGGFFVFNRKIFDYLTEDRSCDLETGVFEKLANDKQMKVYKHDGNWYCMDTPREMEYLNKLWDTGKAFWKGWG